MSFGFDNCRALAPASAWAPVGFGSRKSGFGSNISFTSAPEAFGSYINSAATNGSIFGSFSALRSAFCQQLFTSRFFTLSATSAVLKSLLQIISPTSVRQLCVVRRHREVFAFPSVNFYCGFKQLHI
jgi:hypothetical protein